MARRTFVTIWFGSLLIALAGCGGDGGGGGSLDEQYQQAMKTADPTVRVTQLLGVAGKQNGAGDQAGAERSLSSAAAAARGIASAGGRAAALNHVGTALARMNRPGEAKKLFRDVGKAAEQIEEPETKIATLTRMAYAYGRYLDDPVLATSYLQLCEETAAEVARPEGQVEAMLEVAYVYYGLALTGEMQNLLDRALDAARALEDTRKQADSLAAAGATLCKMKRADEAKTVFKQAQDKAGEIGDPLSRAHALVHLGRKLGESGLKSAAQKILQQAEAAADEVKDQSMRNPLMETIYAARRKL